MAKLDWREIAAGVAGGTAPGVYQGKLQADAKMRLEGMKFQAKTADYESQARRREVQNKKDVQGMQIKETARLEDQLLDGVQDQFTTQNPDGSWSFNVEGATASLEKAGAGKYVGEMLGRHNDFVAIQNKKMTDVADRNATASEGFADNADTDTEYALGQLQAFMPGATGYSQKITADGKPGRMIGMDDGTMIFLGDTDLRDKQLTAHQTAELVQDQSQSEAKLSNPSTALNTYDEIRRRHDAKNVELAAAGLPQEPWQYGDETAWMRGMKQAGTDQGGVNWPEKEIIKAQLQVWKERVKKFEESDLKMAELNKLQTMYKLGLVITEPGKKFELWLEQAIAKAQLWTGADLGLTSEEITRIGYKQSAQMIMMKLAYSNRADFMPGQLSNMENHKLAQMEVSMDTSQEAALWLIDGIRADRKQMKKLLEERVQWIKATKGMMQGKNMQRTLWTVDEFNPDGPMIQKTVDRWSEYVDASNAAHMRKRYLDTKKYVETARAERAGGTQNYGLGEGITVKRS